MYVMGTRMFGQVTRHMRKVAHDMFGFWRVAYNNVFRAMHDVMFAVRLRF